MRARGAQATDVVVLVVAADDGVMPQTIEAIAHARAAGVPIIVAVNKVDKADANPQRVRQALLEHGLVAEDFGGETICVDVSATKGTGVDKLLEMLALQAEVLELRATKKGAARGVVVEAELDRGRGPLATVLVREGTLQPGDAIVAGTRLRSGALADRLRGRDDEGGRAVDAGAHRRTLRRAARGRRAAGGEERARGQADRRSPPDARAAEGGARRRSRRTPPRSPPRRCSRAWREPASASCSPS